MNNWLEQQPLSLHQHNATAPRSAPTMADAMSSVTGIGSLVTLFMSFSGLRDWLKLLVLGGALETLRRFASSIWEWALGSFFLTIHLDVSFVPPPNEIGP
jgi:hypothetical protein